MDKYMSFVVSEWRERWSLLMTSLTCYFSSSSMWQSNDLRITTKWKRMRWERSVICSVICQREASVSHNHSFLGLYYVLEADYFMSFLYVWVWFQSVAFINVFLKDGSQLAWFMFLKLIIVWVWFDLFFPNRK